MTAVQPVETLSEGRIEAESARLLAVNRLRHLQVIAGHYHTRAVARQAHGHHYLALVSLKQPQKQRNNTFSPSFQQTQTNHLP